MPRLRRWKNDVGKMIGGRVYVHRLYEDVIPGIRELAKVNRIGYNVLKWDMGTGAVTFIGCPLFDVQPEPEVGMWFHVRPDRTARDGYVLRSEMRPGPDPWIYHHKWLWVRDDYHGFDVEESKRRSAAWMALPGIDRSRIGKKSYWEKMVLPRLERTI